MTTIEPVLQKFIGKMCLCVPLTNVHVIIDTFTANAKMTLVFNHNFYHQMGKYIKIYIQNKTTLTYIYV